MSEKYDDFDSDMLVEAEASISAVKSARQEPTRSASARWCYEVLMEERKLKALLYDEYDR